MFEFASPVFTLLVIGAAGGSINYFTLGHKHFAESGLLWRCRMLGMLMTFLVPFILSIFEITLIVGSAGSPANLLNYVAICLAVAIAPRFFLVAVSNSVLKTLG